MGRDIVITLIFDELRKAEAKFPSWPTDIVHGAGILVEEAGETMKAALDLYYGRSNDKSELIKEAAQTGAMTIRLLFSLIPEKGKEGEERNEESYHRQLDNEMIDKAYKEKEEEDDTPPGCDGVEILFPGPLPGSLR
jgi:hypothetical protein